MARCYRVGVRMDDQVLQDQCWDGWLGVTGSVLGWMARCYRVGVRMDGQVL